MIACGSSTVVTLLEETRRAVRRLPALSREDREEVVGDVVLRELSARARGRGWDPSRSSLRTYLRLVVRTYGTDQARRHRAACLLPAGVLVADAQPETDRQALNRLLALCDRPQEQRMMALLAQGATVTEAARTMGLCRPDGKPTQAGRDLGTTVRALALGLEGM